MFLINLPAQQHAQDFDDRIVFVKAHPPVADTQPVAAFVLHSDDVVRLRLWVGSVLVNLGAHPARIGGDHYDKYQIKLIAALQDWLSEEEYRGYLRGNAIKYQIRYRDKGGAEDLRKAQWYLAELLKLESGSDEKKNPQYNNTQRNDTSENAISDEMKETP